MSCAGWLWLCALAAVAVQHAGAATSASWPHEHGETRNSGHAELVPPPTPGRAASCASRPLAGAAPPDTVTFSSTGVTSSDGALLLVGGSDNKLYCSPLVPGTGGGGGARAVDLAALFPGAGSNPPDPAHALDGIVAAPAVAPALGGGGGGGDSVFVPSSDGTLYALSLPLGGRAGGCASLAPRWATALPGAVAAAPRAFPDAGAGAEFVAVTATLSAEDGSDANGSLSVLNATSGSMIWTRWATTPTAPLESWGLRGVAPAVDPLGHGSDHAVAIAFGYTLAVWDVVNGGVIAHIGLPNHDGTRRFVGSPVWARDGSSVFVSAASPGFETYGDGWLFHVNTAGDGTDNRMTLKIVAAHQLVTTRCAPAPGGGLPPALLAAVSGAEASGAVASTASSSSSTARLAAVAPVSRPSPRRRSVRGRVRDDEADYSTSTPALTYDGGIVVTSQVAPGASALFRYSVGSGTAASCDWWAAGGVAPLANGTLTSLTLALARAAPALDAAGNAYVAGLAAPDAGSSGGAPPPVLAVYSPAGALLRVAPLPSRSGPAPGGGAAAPSRALLLSADGAPLAVVGDSDGPVTVAEGAVCPSASLALACSGNGACDCVKGACACDEGWGGEDCATPAPPPTATPSASPSAAPGGGGGQANAGGAAASAPAIAGGVVGALAVAAVVLVGVRRGGLQVVGGASATVRSAERQALLARASLPAPAERLRQLLSGGSRGGGTGSGSGALVA